MNWLIKRMLMDKERNKRKNKKEQKQWYPESMTILTTPRMMAYTSLPQQSGGENLQYQL